ncbi:MAG: hypothetical protein ACR2OR_16960 [Hyphomicrobiales bacterium]
MGNVFELNQYSLLGAVAGLLIGIIDVAVASRFIYPAVRMRYETAKAHGRKGLSPSAMMSFLQITGYIVFPIIGIVIANLMFNTQAQTG